MGSDDPQSQETCRPTCSTHCRAGRPGRGNDGRIAAADRRTPDLIHPSHFLETRMTRHFRAFALSVLAVSSLASPAMAHPFGAWGAGFPQGFLHPMLGLDHILAMVGVGFWAGQLGGRALWLVP